MIAVYLHRLHKTIASCGYIEIEQLILDDFGSSGAISGRLRFYDGSLLQFAEELIERGQTVVILRYTYHYQDTNTKLLFRYDNAPHHPNIITFPHHKHIGDTQLQPAAQPQLNDVLREIEQLLFA